VGVEGPGGEGITNPKGSGQVRIDRLQVLMFADTKQFENKLRFRPKDLFGCFYARVFVMSDPTCLCNVTPLRVKNRKIRF
jgi:hypothetical protein